MPGRLASASEEFREDARTRLILVPLASLGLGDATHYLIYVLAAPGPRRFAALAAGHCSAHRLVLSVGWFRVHHTPGGIVSP